MPNTLEDLRGHLFETIKALKDKENPMSIDRARAIAEVAKQVTDSAKAEIEYIRATDRNDAMLPVFGETPIDGLPALPGTTTRVHRIK